jgi:hypothetical protein
MGTDVRTKAFGGYEFNAALQQLFEQEGKFYEIVEALLPLLEFDQQVHIAFRPLLIAHERTEEPEPLHAKRSDSGAILGEHSQDILLCLCDVVHRLQTPETILLYLR